MSATSSPTISSFNSRTPGGVRLICKISLLPLRLFQFTHPGRGATTKPKMRSAPAEVSIHAPREGCDHLLFRLRCKTIKFQFTHPGRGATHLPPRVRGLLRGFNSRTPGGVRLPWMRSPAPLQTFQFTHPGRGATNSGAVQGLSESMFQFTHPGRGATRPWLR